MTTRDYKSYSETLRRHASESKHFERKHTALYIWIKIHVLLNENASNRSNLAENKHMPKANNRSIKKGAKCLKLTVKYVQG